MKHIMRLLLLFITICSMTIFVNCSGKKQLEKGNYVEAVTKSIQKLRNSPSNENAASTLRDAYPMAVSYYKEQIENTLMSTQPYKWSTVITYMEVVNSMADDISRCPAAKKVIPSPFRYDTELNTAKSNAAEECYVVAIKELAKNDRLAAREAYYLFERANGFVYGYKDVQTMMPKAKELATLRVVLEKIPVGAGRLEVSAQFFQNNVEAYINQMFQSRLFYELYSPTQAEKMKLVPDQIIRIKFDDFVVGNVNFSQRKSTVVSKDSVKVGDYAKPDGTKVPVLNKVTADITSYKKEIISKGVVDLTIIDFKSNKVLLQEKIPGEFIWVTQWATYNGDERALTPADLATCKQRELQPPAPQDLFVEFTKPIYDQITSKISGFYSRY